MENKTGHGKFVEKIRNECFPAHLKSWFVRFYILKKVIIVVHYSKLIIGIYPITPYGCVFCS